MNIPEVEAAIKRVIRKHRDAFLQIGSSQPRLLELAAITGMAEHYKSCGYSIKVVNPKGERSFTVKTSTRGFPWNFSRIVADKDGATVELHMNLMVRSAHDEGVYCVDIGVTSVGAVPTEKSDARWDMLPMTP